MGFEFFKLDFLYGVAVEPLNGKLILDIKLVENNYVLNINCAPHDTICKSIDFTFPEFSFEEFFIEFSCKLKKDTVWAHAGYEAGFSQIKLPVLQTVPETETTASMPPFSVYFSEENESGIMSIEGEDFTYRFNMATGSFTNVIFNDIEMLHSTPFFSVCKATTDNKPLLLHHQPCSCKILSKGSKYITLLASVVGNDGNIIPLGNYKIQEKLINNTPMLVFYQGHKEYGMLKLRKFEDTLKKENDLTYSRVDILDEYTLRIVYSTISDTQCAIAKVYLQNHSS